ncbi:type III secretion system outer membrane ring subunit SctC [Burkholderia territorii]|uniref:type III secretion system outer membrane ring subunit SctC n=1 Tax=Burkholderia territorii TaxID=1503055 RepID=UPI000A768FF6|nr:type III secretion system outer membrane ring subunit SctC [Burkholderia territorii]
MPDQTVVGNRIRDSSCILVFSRNAIRWGVWRDVSIFLLLVWACIVPFQVHAASFPWRDAVFSYRAKSTALSRVIEDIFVTQQQPIAISQAVKELPPVSGDFQQAPRQLFNDLMRSYGVVDYFDGTTMHVTTLAESKTVLFPLGKASIRDVERMAREFGYLDRRFGLRAVNASSAVQLSGPPAYIERISDVINVLGSNATQSADSARMSVRVIPLQHAWAEDVTYTIGGRTTVVRGVANSLRRLVDGMDGLDGEAVRDTGLEVPGLPVAPEQRPASVLEGLFERADSGARAQANPPLPPTGRIAGQASGVDLRLNQRPNTFIRVVGDSRMNAVIVMAPADMLPMLESVVRDLDVEPELVQIEAAIIDVQDGMLKEIGFDWTLQGNRLRISSTTSGAGIGQDLSGEGLRGIGPNFAIFGGSAALNFLSRIHALQTAGKANVLSRPKLATLNGIEAVLTNQQIFYPRVSSERVAQLYQVDVGLQMRVVPSVVRRSGGVADIRLQVFIEDGAIGSQRIDALPVTNKSAITTQALVRSGESLLIGGYVRDVNENKEAKVPLLGDIPLLGALFRFRSSQVDRQERVFLITPRLLSQADGEEAPQALGTNDRERELIERFETPIAGKRAELARTVTVPEANSVAVETVPESIDAEARVSAPVGQAMSEGVE